MHRIIFNLFVAVLTFALGIAASLLFNGVISSSAEKVNNRAVSVESAPAPVILSERIPGRCGCNSLDETGLSREETSTGAPINGGILNGKARNLPRPQYPEIAMAAQATGKVAVEILVDERGCVRSARAVGGHPLLQAAAVEAARQACFSPTLLSGEPKKIKGVIIYNFLLK